MDEIIRFFISKTESTAHMLDSIAFSVMGISLTWLDVLLSYAALCIIISVFWRGVRK